jgi:hypothetical protein
MLEHKGSTTPTQTQTITPTKTTSSVLDFLISCHKDKEVEAWTVFEITPEEIQTVWLMLEGDKSLL